MNADGRGSGRQGQRGWRLVQITRDRNNQNILTVAYLLGSLHPFGLMKLDYDLFRADTTTPKLTFWSCRE